MVFMHLYCYKAKNQTSWKRSPDPGIYFNASIHVYSPRAGAEIHWGQMLMTTESPYHFAHLLQVLKQSL